MPDDSTDVITLLEVLQRMCDPLRIRLVGCDDEAALRFIDPEIKRRSDMRHQNKNQHLNENYQKEDAHIFNFECRVIRLVRLHDRQFKISNEVRKNSREGKRKYDLLILAQTDIILSVNARQQKEHNDIGGQRDGRCSRQRNDLTVIDRKQQEKRRKAGGVHHKFKKEQDGFFKFHTQSVECTFFIHFNLPVGFKRQAGYMPS